MDGSASSQQALRWAAQQARLTGEELHAVSVWDYPTGALMLEDIDWFGITRKTLDDAVSASLHPDEADRVQRSILRGYPVRVLLEAAADASLLVVGSRGRGGMVGCCSARSASTSSPTPAVPSSSSTVSRALLRDVAIVVP